MSRGVEDFSKVLSRKQILLAFGMLLVKELEAKGLINRDDAESESVRTQATTVVLELGAEAIDMALKRKRK